MYHYVREAGSGPFPGIRALPPALFEQQLDWLQRRYTVVGVDAVDAAVHGGRPLPGNAALLTFDDGFIDHYEAAFPILRGRGLSGLFFVSENPTSEPRLLGVHKTQLLLAAMGAEAFGRAVLAEAELVPALSDAARAVFGADHWEDAGDRAIKQLINYELPFDDADRVLEAIFTRHVGDSRDVARALYLDPAQIREMARGGMAFGYHTRSHRMLSRLDARAQHGEIGPGVEWIAGLTGQARVSFCYPWGGPQTYTAETVRLLAECGYSLAFNTVRRRLQVGVDGPFEIPRLDTRDLPPYTDGEADD
jgi:peptidoglycan/xylan/chitin deacetylase (PgdA/CDA1 family)